MRYFTFFFLPFCLRNPMCSLYLTAHLNSDQLHFKDSVAVEVGGYSTKQWSSKSLGIQRKVL